MSFLTWWPLFLIPSVLTLFFSYLHSASGASVVAIDNKIEQAMDLVKSHLMYAVREEVEVLKEQIKELCERNSQLEQENAVLKSLANMDQLTQLSSTQISPAVEVVQEAEKRGGGGVLRPGRPLTVLSPHSTLGCW
uniref:TSC22 domain family protein 2-like n=2 Tax=Salmo trutta TaxID=8032 RepID=A0A673ZLU3_SALTR